MRKSIVPFHALVDESSNGLNLESDSQSLLDEAEVVIARDVMTDYETIVFGRQRFEEYEKEGGIAPSMLTVGLDIETEELDRLIVLVEDVKGRHDYLAEIG